MTETVYHGATLIDGTGADPRPNASVLVEGGVIRRVGTAESIGRSPEGRVIDLDGLTLMPGLTDAHVHFGALGVNSLSDRTPDDNLTTYVLGVVENMRTALQEGFTTVRDAGGLDPAFARAVDDGLIEGPEILPSGSVLSQTGGHGDARNRYDDEPLRSIPGVLARAALCDGVDAVRAAARQQLRLGATQVKLMASGGVMSPTDELESVQFTVEEMAAATHEAEAAGKYTMAHCHTSPAMNNALAAGVRSLEHGSMLDEATAARIADAGAYMVATLAILDVLAETLDPETSGHGYMKLELIRTEMPASVRLAVRSGVTIGSGSDLLGSRQARRGAELAAKAPIMGPMEAIVSATRTNSRLFRLEDRIGTVQEGKQADLIAVAGDPLSDMSLLADGSNVRMVVKAGRIVKDTLSG